jgi:hypothetical protein
VHRELDEREAVLLAVPRLHAREDLDDVHQPPLGAEAAPSLEAAPPQLLQIVREAETEPQHV